MFNIFTIAFVAIFLGLLLAVFITRQKTPNPIQYAPPEDDCEKDPKNVRALELRDLYRLGEKICQKNQLQIKEKVEIDSRESYWITENHNDLFFGNYVIGFHQATEQDPFVSLGAILEFKDFVKGAVSAKGLYITTGYFTKDVLQPLEGPKVGLYNRLKVIGEMKQFGLEL